MNSNFRALTGCIPGAPSVIEALAKAPARLAETEIRLAVTGLSRAGKTVFITAIIQNLLSAVTSRGNGRQRMALFRALNTGGVTGAALVGSAAGTVPPFPFHQNLRQMAAVPPDWPAGTSNVSEAILEL